MHDVLLDDAAWYRALGLAERLEDLRRAAGPLPPPADPELAQRELEAWRGQPPFDAGDWFARRLAQDGLSADELLTLLGEGAESVRDRCAEPPAWLATLARAYERAPCRAAEALPLPEELRQARTVGFLDAIEPLLSEARARLQAGVHALLARQPCALIDAATAADLLLHTLPWRLHMALQRAIVLELNAARLHGELPGATPEERFEQFLQRLRTRDGALALLADYPVLARSLVRSLDKWVRFGLEFLGHLAADAEALTAHFFPGQPPGVLATIDGGAGDPHRQGRSVVIAGFASGARLVYKPRSMAVDEHFQELLAWLNARGAQPPFRTVSLLRRPDHGWMEFLPSRPCATDEEVRRFYRGQGGLLALLYALEATDCHFENLIACGEHPVLVDLETLFHPRVQLPPIQQTDARLVGEATFHSVLRVGLLPQRAFASEEYAGVDLSGMGGAPGQLSPDRMLQWQRVGTDEMHARRERVEMPGSNNRPRLLEREVSILDFADEICGGFADAYRLLCALRVELLAPDGLLARFAPDEVRCVLRATRHYGLLLREFDHPDFQRDALELERFVDRLWVGVDESPSLEVVIAAERADLLEGDIPFFSTCVGSRHLQTSRGARLPDYWDHSGLNLVRRRMELLGEADLERQLWFVRASLATLTLSQDKLPWPSYRPVAPAAPPGSTELAAALTAQATAIGDRLAALALRDSEDLTWIGLAFHQRQWGLVPLMEDLYAGSSGVIHFLAYLGEVTGEERYTRLARAALATLRRRLQQTRPHLTSIGLFNGIGGLIYGFAHWSALWHEPALLEEAHALVDRLPELIAGDTALDVVGGSAGCVAALLTLERVAHAPRHLELAAACGERILAGAKPMDVGVGWYTQIETHKPITGFSHGGSGMAHALLHLAEATGDDRFRRTALEALRYEHTQFLPGQGNWMETGAAADESRPDGPQSADGQQALSLAWCYGAPGIALARLAALSATPALDAPFLADEAAAAVRSTRERGFGRNHSLCHGDLGNLDVLLHAASVLQDESLAAEIPRRAAMVLTSMQRDGWICGVPLGVESPALMNGLAGIGYGLLRVAHPERVPSVLAMEPPRL